MGIFQNTKTRVAGNPALIRQLVTGAAITGGSMLMGSDPVTALGQGIGGAAMGYALRRGTPQNQAFSNEFTKAAMGGKEVVTAEDRLKRMGTNKFAGNLLGGVATGAGVVGGGLVGGVLNGITNNIITSTGSSSNNQTLDPATLQSAAQAQQRSLQKAQQDQQLATFYLQSLGVLQ